VAEAYELLQAQRTQLEKAQTSTFLTPATVPALPRADNLTSLVDTGNPWYGILIKFSLTAPHFPADDGTTITEDMQFVPLGSDEEKAVFVPGQRRPVKHWVERPGAPLPSDTEILKEFGIEDPKTWSTAPDGKPLKPILHTIYLHCAQWTGGTLYDLALKSWSARKQLGPFGTTIAQQRATNPGCRPIITLGVGRAPTQHGYIPVPRFNIVSWVDPDGRPLRLGQLLDDQVIDGDSR
jgi:hypothetical protein